MKGERITLSYTVKMAFAACFFAYLVESIFCVLLSPKYSYFYVFSAIAYVLLAFAAIASSISLRHVLKWILRFKGASPDDNNDFSSRKAAFIFVALTPTLLYGYFQVIMVYRWSILQISSLTTFALMFAFFFILCAVATRGMKPDRFDSLKTALFYLIIAGPLITNMSMFFLTGEILGDFGSIKLLLSIIFHIGFVGALVLILSRIFLALSKFKANLVFASFLLIFMICLVLAVDVRDRHIYSYGAETTSLKDTHNLKSPDIILLVMDTARYDRVSCYGYHEQTTPHIDAFAGQSVVFTNAVAAAPWTLPSHASMFTGLPSFVHSAVHSSSDKFMSANILSNSFTTLAELLRQAGYATGGSVSNSGYVGPWTGLNQGFDYYWVAMERGAWTFLSILAMKLGLRPYKKFLRYTGIDFINSAKRINEMALKWIRKTKKERKNFFLFLNYMEPHGMNFLSGPYSQKFIPPLRNVYLKERDEPCSVINDLTTAKIYSKWYDNQMASLDNEIGCFLHDLKKNDLFDDSLVIVTSDHGELLGEHQYYGHQYFLYEELLKIPLIIKYPSSLNSASHVGKRVLNLDLFAEILDVAEVPIPETVVGKPFRLSDRTVFAEVRSSQRSVECPERFGKDLVCIYSSEAPGFKMIFNPNGSVELYDLENDPLEQENRLSSDPTVRKSLEDFLARHLQGLNLLRRIHKSDFEKSKLDKATLDRLRALGYIK